MIFSVGNEIFNSAKSRTEHMQFKSGINIDTSCMSGI